MPSAQRWFYGNAGAGSQQLTGPLCTARDSAFVLVNAFLILKVALRRRFVKCPGLPGALPLDPASLFGKRLDPKTHCAARSFSMRGSRTPIIIGVREFSDVGMSASRKFGSTLFKGWWGSWGRSVKRICRGHIRSVGCARLNGHRTHRAPEPLSTECETLYDSKSAGG